MAVVKRSPAPDIRKVRRDEIGPIKTGEIVENFRTKNDAEESGEAVDFAANLLAVKNRVTIINS